MTSETIDLMTEGNAVRKPVKANLGDARVGGAGPDADCLPDSGEAPMKPNVFWSARIGMTIWFIVSVVLGLLGFSYLASVPMVAVGTLLYQGFNGLPRPWMNEATLRILFYSAVGISVVFFFFFAAGRLIRWLFV